MTFMFATGIENSIPLIKDKTHRVDQYEKCGHYQHWKTDFDRVEECGIRFLRYGTPLHTTHLGPGSYDWSFSDETFADLRRRRITPIMDLCHFGVPDWIGDFQNTDWPEHFAEYAEAFARRYPWVRHYTPVNEMFICAAFSTLYGWWNEQLMTHRGFVTACKNIAKANRMAMQRILKVRPDAVFIQAESMEYFHAETPEAATEANFKNQIRFLCLDLSYGHSLDKEMALYTTANGMSPEERSWFSQNPIPRSNCILGIDYYITNERYVRADGSTESSGDILGLAAVAKQYWNRYKLPMMHSETNMHDHPDNPGASEAWLRKQWSGLMGLRQMGVPVLGFTWYSLNDQVDWCSALRENAGRVNSLGLYDLDRNERPVGRAYRELIRAWAPVLNDPRGDEVARAA